MWEFLEIQRIPLTTSRIECILKNADGNRSFPILLQIPNIQYMVYSTDASPSRVFLYRRFPQTVIYCTDASSSRVLLYRCFSKPCFTVQMHPQAVIYCTDASPSRALLYKCLHQAVFSCTHVSPNRDFLYRCFFKPCFNVQIHHEVVQVPFYVSQK